MPKPNLERLLVPVSVPCYDWNDYSGETSRKTVIISPIRIVDDGNGVVQVSWGCNRGAFCKDKNCRYSHTAQNQEL